MAHRVFDGLLVAVWGGPEELLAIASIRAGTTFVGDLGDGQYLIMQATHLLSSPTGNTNEGVFVE